MGFMQLALLNDDALYQDLQNKQIQEWEDICISCGMCCGVKDGDPCEYLMQENGRYRCKVYHNRFGLHRTKEGREFRCVPIREILHKNWPGDHLCTYKNSFQEELCTENKLRFQIAQFVMVD